MERVRVTVELMVQVEPSHERDAVARVMATEGKAMVVAELALDTSGLADEPEIVSCRVTDAVLVLEDEQDEEDAD